MENGESEKRLWLGNLCKKSHAEPSLHQNVFSFRLSNSALLIGGLGSCVYKAPQRATFEVREHIFDGERRVPFDG